MESVEGSEATTVIDGHKENAVEENNTKSETNVSVQEANESIMVPPKCSDDVVQVDKEVKETSNVEEQKNDDTNAAPAIEPTDIVAIVTTPLKEESGNETGLPTLLMEKAAVSESNSLDESKSIETNSQVTEVPTTKNAETVSETQDVNTSDEQAKAIEISSNFTDNSSSSPNSNISKGTNEINSDILNHEAMDVSSIETKNNVSTTETEKSYKSAVNLESSNQILNENVCMKEAELNTLLDVANIKAVSTNSSPAKPDQNEVPSSSLKLLAEYNSDTENECNNNCEADSEDNDVMEVPLDASTDYRNIVVEIKSESESESSSSDDSDAEYLSKIRKEIEGRIDLVDEDEEDDDDDAMSISSRKKKQNNMRVKGELALEDLPPIQDLHITVPEKDCIELGRVHSIVDQLLLVSVLPDSLLLDLDTVLFLEKGQKVLGVVFDVLGQVADPLYCIRFNTNQEIDEKNIKVGDIVYVAPKTEYTQFVILSSLMKLRGSDASWENDVEPPPRYLDYSDDEQEREARTRLRNKDRPNDHQEPTKRPRGFEENEPTPSTSSSAYSGVPKTRNLHHEGRFNRERGNTSRQSPSQYRQGYVQNPMNAGSWHSNYRRSFPQPPHSHGRQMVPPSMYPPNVMPPNYAMYPPYSGYPTHPIPPPSPAQNPMFVLNPLAVAPPPMFTQLPPPKLSPHSPPPAPPGLD